MVAVPGETLVAGVELTVAVYNATVLAGSMLVLFWLGSLLARFFALLQERKMIELGNVVVLSDEHDHPEWLERAYVARLANRQARVVPSEPVQSVDVPFSVLSMSGDAADPFVATASARVLCKENVKRVQFCFLFGVERALWNNVKLNGLPRDFSPQKHSVLACDWSETNFNEELEKDVSSMSAYMMPGKHLPQMDDVSVLFLLRMGGIVLAITAATDVRMLESVILIEGQAPLSVRETFSEDEPDCLVCCERPKNVVLLPCRHTCCCSVCLARLDKCPVCRAAVESFVSFNDAEEQHVVAAVPEEEFPREILNDVQVVINRHADAVPDEEFQQDVTEDVEVVSNREE